MNPSRASREARRPLDRWRRVREQFPSSEFDEGARARVRAAHDAYFLSSPTPARTIFESLVDEGTTPDHEAICVHVESVDGASEFDP